jgi:hypothetical protein
VTVTSEWFRSLHPDTPTSARVSVTLIGLRWTIGVLTTKQSPTHVHLEVAVEVGYP